MTKGELINESGEGSKNEQENSGKCCEHDL